MSSLRTLFGDGWSAPLIIALIGHFKLAKLQLMEKRFFLGGILLTR